MHTPTPADLATRHRRTTRSPAAVPTTLHEDRTSTDPTTIDPPPRAQDGDDTPTAARPVLVARRDGTRADAAQVLAVVAELLTPCAPPDVANGWTLCAHAEAWPCPITRAAWLARGLAPVPRGDLTTGHSTRVDSGAQAQHAHPEVDQ